MNKRQAKKFKKKGYHKKCGYSFIQEIIDIIRNEPCLIFKPSTGNPQLLCFRNITPAKSQGLPQAESHEITIEFKVTQFVADGLDEKADVLRRQYEKSFNGTNEN